MTADQPSINGVVTEGRRQPEQRRSRARVERVLDVTAELIRQEGIAAVTMSRVAEAADVSLPSIYRYFPSKRAILETLLMRYTDRARATVFGGTTVATSPDEALYLVRHAFGRYWDFVRNDPAYMAVWSAGLADPELAQVIIEIGRANAEIFLSRLRPAIPAGADSELAMFTMSYLGAATARMAIMLPPEEADEVIENLLVRVIPGMLGLAD